MWLHAQVLELTGETEQARHWLRRSADHGHTGAMVHLGSHLVDEDAEAAERYFRSAADGGDLDGMLQLAHLLTLAGRTDEAIDWDDRVVAAVAT